MDIHQIADFIHFVSPFHDLPREQLEQLAGAATVRDCQAKEVLTEPDHQANALFVIVQGEFRMTLASSGGDFEKELARLMPGDYFGAATVFTGRQRQVTVRAVTAGKVISLSQESIDALFEQSPVFARAMCRSLAYHLEQNTEKVAAIAFVQLGSFPDLSKTIDLIPDRIIRACQCVPVERVEDRVTVAMVNPGDTRARTFLVDVLRQYHVEFVAITEDDFGQCVAKYLGREVSVRPADQPLDELIYLSSDGEAVPIATGGDDILPRVFTSAIRMGASDIHIEPGEDSSRVRLRIDGRMLVIEDGISPQQTQHLLSRIKIIAELDITKARRPQDGSFFLRAGARRAEFRVSVCPCRGGEKMVLRVVNPNPDFERLRNLILCEPAAVFAEEMLERPSGLLLVTGPTGSGKTTTLYAALHTLNSLNQLTNVVTIEDPIEHNLPFATQIQINRAVGLDFPVLLRTVLRQDPDTILVGEIRDAESAAIAVDAATTGHLVLSSVHTYSALETLVRLRNLGVKPYLLANALKGVISQQLVPRLSPMCARECATCNGAIAEQDPVVQRLRRLGVLDDNFVGTMCRGRSEVGSPFGGTKGRVGAFELLAVTDQLRDLIDRVAPASEIEASLNDDCFFSFAKYCRFLLRERLASPEDVERLFPKIPEFRRLVASV